MKLSKASTHYTDDAGAKHDKCRICKHFQKPDSCEIVLGKISPKGWCTEFEDAGPDR